MSREVTKMDITNISMVLAPNLFLYLPASRLGCDDVTLASKTSHVVMLLIKYHPILWTVSYMYIHVHVHNCTMYIK